MKTQSGNSDSGRQTRRARPLILVVALALLYGPPLHGQEPQGQLRVSRAPYHVGLPMEIQLHVTGLEREPEPVCEAEAMSDGSLRLVGLIPNVSTQITMVNGRTTRSETVTFVCQYEYIPRRKGNHRFPPFKITQGQTVVETAAYAIEAEALEPDPKLKLKLRLPDEPIFVGQQVPVVLEWWIDERLQQTIHDYSIRSELFEDSDTYRFLEPTGPPATQQTLNIQTQRGQVPLPATARREKAGGHTFVILAAERVLVPLRPGTFRLAGATVNALEVTSWRRDLFGGRRPAATRPIFGQDTPRTLVVKPPPQEERPSSFGGAVGRGFSFAVETDRSVVQTGDPIVLTFTVSGSGELDPVGLPPLNTLLPPDRFRLPEDEISGQVVAGTKAFRVPVRVTDASVTEIPALPYSWFDPEAAEYQTTYSLPVALSVRPARVVSAEDVVSARSQSDNEAEPAPLTERNASGELETPWPESGTSDADLAIEVDPELLRAQPGISATRQAALYGLSLALLVSSWGIARRRNVNPDRLRLRRLERTQRRRIENARGKPSHEALAEIASALRELASARPGTSLPEVETFITDCDNILYAPGESRPEEAVNESVHRALELADQLIALPEEVPS